jgi:hypothetical protein
MFIKTAMALMAALIAWAAGDPALHCRTPGFAH